MRWFTKVKEIYLFLFREKNSLLKWFLGQMANVLDRIKNKEYLDCLRELVFLKRVDYIISFIKLR